MTLAFPGIFRVSNPQPEISWWTRAAGIITAAGAAVVFFFRVVLWQSSSFRDALDDIDNLKSDAKRRDERITALETQNREQASAMEKQGERIQTLELQVEEKTVENDQIVLAARHKGVELGKMTLPARGSLRGRILIVDDDAAASKPLSRILAYKGFVVTAVSSVAAAMTAIDSDHFDFAFLDLMLPDGTGATVLKYIRDSGKPCLVALATGCMDERYDAARAMNPDIIFNKPVDIEAIRAWLAEKAPKA